MPDNDEDETSEIETETQDDDTDKGSEDDAGDSQDSEKGSEDADSGLKKALAAERKLRRDAEAKAKAAEQKLADKDKDADQIAADQALRDAEKAALAKANERVVRSELKAAAAEKVKRPDLLVKVTDLASIEVDENGDPDPEALNEAIEAFLADYPELAVDKSKFNGSADQGSKGKSSTPAQLTRSDLSKMTPDQINKAREEGRLNKVMGLS